VVKGFNDAYALDTKYRVAHHGEATLPPSGAGGVARAFTLVEGSDASQVVLDEDGLTITAFAVNHTRFSGGRLSLRLWRALGRDQRRHRAFADARKILAWRRTFCFTKACRPPWYPCCTTTR